MGRLFLVCGIVFCGLTLSVGSAQAVHDTYWCSAHPTLDPCISSASVNGVPITPSDANYDVWAIPSTAGGAHTIQWSIQPVSAPDLSAAAGETFSITIDTTVVPRVIDAYASSLNYTRAFTKNASGYYEVTVSGKPISVTDQSGCSYPAGGPTCSAVAPGPSSVVFSGEIDDYDYTNYSSQDGLVDAFYGMTMLTNIAETGLPPNLLQSYGRNELQIDLADHHFLQDGTTVVHGNFVLEIPDSFLATFWDINDPSTLASYGLNATVGAGGGTLTVTVVPGTGVQVAITGLTFSRRKLTIKLGVVTALAPTRVRATRTSGTTARVTFNAARTRGQKVNRYAARCNGHRVKVSGTHSPVRIGRLTPGVAYTCTLRGRSRAGYGAASKPFVIPS